MCEVPIVLCQGQEETFCWLTSILMASQILGTKFCCCSIFLYFKVCFDLFQWEKYGHFVTTLKLMIRKWKIGDDSLSGGSRMQKQGALSNWGMRLQTMAGLGGGSCHWNLIKFEGSCFSNGAVNQTLPLLSLKITKQETFVLSVCLGF